MCTMSLAIALLVAIGHTEGTRYAFYRDMREAGASPGAAATRRVFGGEAASMDAFPGVCALLDRYWAARCSGAVLAPRWALTAAHCVTPQIAYVKYDTRRPTSPDGRVSPILYLYRHPKYKVVQEDEGRGPDVTLLHHDVGLVRTRDDMALSQRSAVPREPLAAMRLYDPVDLKNQEVQVLGFGRTERSTLGEELFSVRLRLVMCDRGAWFHCVCGVEGATGGGGGEGRGEAEGGAKGLARVGAGAGAAGVPGGRGVCSGDSGGPVLYRGAQVAVTSMGPVECGAPAPATTATSVFTSLYHYAELINATIADTEAALRMRIIAAAHARAPLAPLPLLLLTAAVHVFASSLQSLSLIVRWSLRSLA